MANTVVSLGLWYFLPNFATGWLQTIYYSFRYKAGEPKPQAGDPRYARDRRAIFTLVIVAYLLYTIVEADWNMQQRTDFYQIFGVHPDADERLIQSRMRKIAATHHPDKVPPEQQPRAELIFRTSKFAQEVLTDKVKRFAYDRLGPDIFESSATAYQQCKTIGDFVALAVRGVGVYYLMFAAVTTVFTFLNIMPHGKYWRWVILAAMATFELTVLTRPRFPRLLTHIVNPFLTAFTSHPPLLPFQLVAITRTIWSSFFIALNQIAPLYRGSAAKQDTSDAAVQQQLNVQQQILTHLNDRASRLLGLEIVPFRAHKGDMERARDQTKAWMMKNRIAQDPGVQAAVQRVLERREAGDGTET